MAISAEVCGLFFVSQSVGAIALREGRYGGRLGKYVRGSWWSISVVQ